MSETAVVSAGDRSTTAWIDLASPSHPFFFAGIAEGLDAEVVTTARRKTETVPLARSVGLDPAVVGRDFDNTVLRKAGIPLRTAQLAASAPAGDVSLSARNAMCVLASRARGIPSIHFTDNDITAHVPGLTVERLYNCLEARATYSVVPSAFDTDELTRYGVDPARIYTYDGYKEDVSVAAFDPDPTFPERLPFDEFVVIRPEALTAAYVDADSIVPALLDGIADLDVGVVYLPRGRGDAAFAEPYGTDEVFVPPNPLDGLQLAWHARCVLTGSGTMAREAACMDTPAVSFFPAPLLSIDRQLVAEDRLLHSRRPGEIVAYLEGLDAADAVPDRSCARRVRSEVVDVVEELIGRCTR